MILFFFPFLFCFVLFPLLFAIMEREIKYMMVIGMIFNYNGSCGDAVAQDDDNDNHGEMKPEGKKEEEQKRKNKRNKETKKISDRI